MLYVIAITRYIICRASKMLGPWGVLPCFQLTFSLRVTVYSMIEIWTDNTMYLVLKKHNYLYGILNLWCIIYNPYILQSV